MSESDEEPMLQGEDDGKNIEKPRRRHIRKHTDIVIVDNVEEEERDASRTFCGMWTEHVKVFK